MKEMYVITAGYENINFLKSDRSDPAFRDAILNPPALAPGTGGYFLYDITRDLQGRDILKLAPGSNIALGLKIVYHTNVPDMILPGDTPDPIPREHWDYIVTWMVCNVLRTKNDPRLTAFVAKLKDQEGRIVNAVGTRQTREPIFVKGFDEMDYYA
jgi:hypothetical protein